MLSLRLLGLVGIVGAAAGAYLSGVVKEKLGVGGATKADKNKVEIIRLKKGEELVATKAWIREADEPKKD